MPCSSIFSGIQPSGVPTLGNYLGAAAELGRPAGRDHECLYCVVDLHAITQFQDPAGLAAATREMAAALLACGVDAGASTSCSISPPSPHMPGSAGSSPAWPGSAGSTA